MKNIFTFRPAGCRHNAVSSSLFSNSALQLHVIRHHWSSTADYVYQIIRRAFAASQWSQLVRLMCQLFWLLACSVFEKWLQNCNILLPKNDFPSYVKLIQNVLVPVQLLPVLACIIFSRKYYELWHMLWSFAKLFFLISPLDKDKSSFTF